MIVEAVFFDLPAGTTRAAALGLYRRSAGNWAENPDLIEKYYFFDEARSLGGGVYVWPDREAARRWHGAEYEATVAEVYGAPPKIQILDALIRVDPGASRIEEV
jgi:hypothetical protein